ncbi:MAG: cyclopropane-fatty-acyl-phospholipid synthase family protein [Acidimicrobiia bacterium]|nr:cyclopropane-fatty-acyl-phospholipid synthase family protein [Acidimicrobiia bacterium]
MTTRTAENVANTVQPLLSEMLTGPPPLRIDFWDGSAIGPEDSIGTIRLNSPDALRRAIWSPNHLGFARAFVAGDIDAIGPLDEILRSMQQAVKQDKPAPQRLVGPAYRAARELDLLGRQPDTPPEEIVPRGVRHSIGRDKQVVGHHYDVGNRFYELVLGPSMTYSCARFVDDEATLEQAQASKHDHIARKLGLAEASFRSACPGPRPRLLDVGCGWGSMAIHAATTYDVDVVGVTISDEQADYARRRVADLELEDRIEIRIQDYRLVADGPFDAISSIGMAEHVGRKRMVEYFRSVHRQVRPGGRILNHAIASMGGARLGRRSFMARYVFPDGELLDLATTIASMESAGFEIRDVENLREHYARTLRCWVANLEENWDAAVGEVGERRARVWRLYMSGCINGFNDGGFELQQTLGVKSDGQPSGFPPTRAGWT